MRYGKRLNRTPLKKQTHIGEGDRLYKAQNGNLYMSFVGQHEVSGLETGERTSFRIWYDPKRGRISWGENIHSLPADYRDVIEALRYFLKKLDSDKRTKKFQYSELQRIDAYIDKKDVYGVNAIAHECGNIGVNCEDQMVSPYINCYGRYHVAREVLPELLDALEDFIEVPEA